MKVNRKEIWGKFNGHCAYCGCTLENETGKHMHIDHVEPVYRNAYKNNQMYKPQRDTIENMVPACVRCNLYKSTLSIEHFRE